MPAGLAWKLNRLRCMTPAEIGHRVVRASWSSADARWTVETDTQIYTCAFLYLCTGYYRYDEGFTPELPGTGRFRGTLVHPQHWPEDLARLFEPYHTTKPTGHGLGMMVVQRIMRAHGGQTVGDTTPFTAPSAIDSSTLGTVIFTEFQKPPRMPSHSSPVHAACHALCRYSSPRRYRCREMRSATGSRSSSPAASTPPSSR